MTIIEWHEWIEAVEQFEKAWRMRGWLDLITDTLSEATTTEIIQTGMYGHVFSADIHVSSRTK